MDHFFWVVLKDARDRQITVTLGQIGDTWNYQSGVVPEHLAYPIEVTSLQTFMQSGGDGGSPTTWFIDDLKATGPDFEIILLDFEGDSLWTPLATSNGLDDKYTDAPEPPNVGVPGSGIGRVQLERGTVSGVRGIYQSSNGEPMPVIVSGNFAAIANIVVGEPAVVQIGGGFVPVIPVGTTELFPTLDPSDRPFMIVDVTTLLELIELRGLVNMNPNEAFLDIDQENHAQVTADIRRLFRGSSLLDRAARVEDSVIDPLTVAGWRGMGVVSLIIGGVALVLGYVTYLVAHSNRTMHDSAYLRAMGLSKPGFMRSALIEHGIVAIVGIGVGIGAGLFASRVAVGAIAHSDSGRALLPPFILETSWWPLIFVLTIAAAAGFIGVVSAFIAFLRKPLHELTRSAE
jgi:ABC-type antimicrobial peptide transport system permease subunit